jgi:predicted RNA-binding protein with TRAM domain
MNDQIKPVSVGDEIDVSIEAVGRKGDGIAKVNNFVLFIPGAKENTTVKVKVNKVLAKVGFADIVGEATSAPVAQAAHVRQEIVHDESKDSDEF